MTEPKPTTSRREFLETTGLVGRRSRPWRALRSRRCTPPKTTRSGWPWSAAAAGAPGRPAMPCRPGKARSSWWPWPTSSRTGSATATRALKKDHNDKVDVTLRSQVHRLRRLQEGDGLPEAGRRGDPRHAAGISLGALHLRHPEGPQRLHGEAGHGRRADHPPDARPGRRGQEEEPQGGRRPDVPPLRGAAGAASTGSRTARSATSSCCGPTARPGRSARP